MSNESTCPIWGTRATESSVGRDGRNIDSPRAGGKYFISGSAEATASNLDNENKAKLTSWLIEQRYFGVGRPEVNSNIIKSAQNRIGLVVKEKADRLLRCFANSESNPGAGFFLPESNTKEHEFFRALAHVESSTDFRRPAVQEQEIIFYAEYLANQGWICSIDRTQDLAGFPRCKITVDGYTRLEELQGSIGSSSSVFVAMWFDEEMNSALIDGIEPGIQDAGYKPLRVDQVEHVDKIDDRIIAEIRRARFVVADFTQGDSGARGGVYYEAGFAHGLGIPVIFTCRVDALEKVHFDTRQYNHIVWETPEDLREKLTNRIEAAIGEGPLKRSG